MPSNPTPAWPVFGLLLCCLALGPGCSSRSKLPRAKPVTPTAVAEAEDAEKRGNWERAAELWYSVFAGSKRKDVRSCAGAANAMLALEDPESASKLLDQGLAAAPESAALHELKGLALVQLNFRRAAEGCFVQATRLEPQRASAWRALGQVRVELGYEGAAIEPLQRALQLGGPEFGTLAFLARAQAQTGDTCAAFESYMRAFEIGGDDPELLTRAASLHWNELVRKAHGQAAACCRAWLERALTINPNFTRAAFELGALEEEEGRIDAAIARYREALRTDPAFLPALRNLAVIHAARQDDDLTREYVQRALALEKDPDRKKALLRLLEPLARPDPPKPVQDGSG